MFGVQGEGLDVFKQAARHEELEEQAHAWPP